MTGQKTEEETIEKTQAKAEQSPEDAKVTELESHLKRVQAEFDNYKKRVAKEKEEIAQRSNTSFVKKLLDLVDELELALMHSKGKKDEHVKGMR